jgi:hypothetical protein
MFFSDIPLFFRLLFISARQKGRQKRHFVGYAAFGTLFEPLFADNN